MMNVSTSIACLDWSLLVNRCFSAKKRYLLWQPNVLPCVVVGILLRWVVRRSQTPRFLSVSFSPAIPFFIYHVDWVGSRTN